MPITAKNVFKIAICGSNASGLPPKYSVFAQKIGELIATKGHTLFTGVTSGFSYEAVKGAYKKNGNIVGISPAESFTEHADHYEKVDQSLWTTIIYTGVGYKMRDVIMIRSVDAAIYIGGGVGTLVEMSAAPDQGTVMGILEGSGGATDLIEDIERISHRKKPIVVSHQDPKKLVEALLEKLEGKI